MRLQRLFGGLRLAGHKDAATVASLHCPLPDELAVPLAAHAGLAPRSRVQPGQRVVAGECLAAGDDPRCIPVHAPCTAEVLGSEWRPAVGLPGVQIEHLRLRPLAEGETRCFEPLDPHGPIEPLRQRVREAGIVGMGGAGFPTHDKLSTQRPLLIVNGAECEPYIACDDRLLREQPARALQGAALAARMVGASRCLLAVEDSMPEAAAALRAQLSPASAVEVLEVPTLYPQGGERQLIQTLTGREVPLGGLPRDIGVLVLNVATCAAIEQAVCAGRPLTRRWVSLSGPGIVQPRVLDVAIGTPILHLVAQCGGYRERAQRLILGGLMMGVALPSDAEVIGKTSNSVLVLDRPPAAATASALPCIRCGACAEVCPARLLPQQLHAFALAERWDRLQSHALSACIECGCCDLVCPSQLPLTQQFRASKRELRLRDDKQRRASAAGERFAARTARLQRDAEARESRMAEKRRQLEVGAAAVAEPGEPPP